MLVSCTKINCILWTLVGEFLTDFCRNSHICFSLKSVLSCFSINPKCPPPPAFPFWRFHTIKLVSAAVECFAQHSFLNFTALPPVKTLLWAVRLPPLFCKFLVLTLLFCGFLFNTLFHSSKSPTPEYPGLQPNSQQSECTLGTRLGPGAAVQGCLRPTEWDPTAWVCEWCTILHIYIYAF